MKNTTINILNDFQNKKPNLNNIGIMETTELLINCFKKGNKILVCGNGGSASDAEHIVGELMKGFVLKRKLSEDIINKIDDMEMSSNLQLGLPAISLVSQTSLMTAILNDMHSDYIFAQQVLGYGKENDVLICLSTSGNSKNCVNAAKVAKALNMKVISFTGSSISKLSSISDITLRTPSNETFEIQEYHLQIYHVICLAIENDFFSNHNY